MPDLTYQDVADAVQNMIDEGGYDMLVFSLGGAMVVTSTIHGAITNFASESLGQVKQILLTSMSVVPSLQDALHDFLDGVFEWLFNVFNDAGLDMPSEFSPAGVTQFVLQGLSISTRTLQSKGQSIADGAAKTGRQTLGWTFNAINSSDTGKKAMKAGTNTASWVLQTTGKTKQKITGR